MHIIAGNNINTIMIKASKKLLNYGHLCDPRDIKTREILNSYILLNNPRDSVITLKSRKLSLKYLCGEFLWYFSGDLNIELISKYSNFWNKLKDKKNHVNSNYGYYIFCQKIRNNKTQFEWCIDSLNNDIYSRQAIINFNQLYHKDYIPMDFVCTISQQFFIRNNRLHSIVNSRSNDLIYGISYDVPFFTLIQEMLYFKLKKKYPYLKLGKYYHNSNSLHVYEKFFDMLNKLSIDRSRNNNFHFPNVDENFFLDIKNKTNKSKLMKCINYYAESKQKDL